MSRKWERMVERNRKMANKYRARSGKAEISSRKSDADVFKGRSILLSVSLISIGLIFMILYGGTQEKDLLYWITVFAYIFLGLYFFFLKRPFLKVRKSQISTRRFGRERFLEAKDIEKITVQPGYVIIKLKGQKTNWIFSRVFNRYDTIAMSARLKEFAEQHSIPFVMEIG